MSQRLNCPGMWSIETLFCYYNQNISKSNFRNDVISAILAKNLFFVKLGPGNCVAEIIYAP